MVFLFTNVHAAIKSEQIDYQVDGQTFSGYLSYDDAVSGKRPGVLVVHEWWGHNDYVRKRVDMLAELGYTAFALDMYGAGKLAQHPDDAKNLLQQHATVDADKIAAIGYCFGGGIVLNMVRLGNDLDAVVSFHGSLGSSISVQPGQISARILVLNGADDPFVTKEQIAAFEQEMQTADAKYEFVNYPGVKHSFTNPEANAFGQRFNMPLVYDAGADKDSWQRMQLLLKQVFAQ